jgi:hypothetical protein
MVFDDKAQNLLRLRWFISTNAGQNATGPPAGDDITATESPTPFFLGSNIIVTVNINQDYPVDRHYIKMYAENDNAVVVVANATVILQALTAVPTTQPTPPTTLPATTPTTSPATTPTTPTTPPSGEGVVPPKGGAVPV